MDNVIFLLACFHMELFELNIQYTDMDCTGESGRVMKVSGYSPSSVSSNHALDSS